MSVPNPPELSTYPEDYVPPAPFPSPVSSMTLHITKGTPPNEVTYTESIPYASFGENSFAITNQQLIDDFSNKPPGTKYSYHITTNFVPGSFPTGDVVTTPTVTNQTVKAIPILDIQPITYNPAIEVHSVLETVNSTSDGTMSYAISNTNVLSIEPGSGEIIAVGSGTATVTITQNSTPEYEGTTRYEKIIVESTPEGSLVVSVEELRLQLLNNVTIRDTGNSSSIPDTAPLFVQEDPRGTRTPEWFAIVDNRHRQAITNYANGNSTPFTPPGQSTPVPFNNIVTTHVTNMAGLFQGATAFNSDISSWDTSRVENMAGMFNGATAFDQPLNSWDTSRVMSMVGMFSNASAFNGLIGNWNTSRVIDMSSMFANAINFNQPLNNWNTSSVFNMSSMFQGATRFNGLIGNWFIPQVRNMSFMFANATAFDRPLNWFMWSVSDMSGMFQNATLFDQPLNHWNTSQVTNMSGMFAGAIRFNGLIGNWNTSRVTNMSFMFAGATLFDQNINTNQDTVIWRVSQVTSFQNFRTDSAISTPNTPLRFVNAVQ